MSSSTSQTIAPLTANTLITAPTVPQPVAGTADVVGLVWQNNQSSTLPGQYVTMGQVFKAGDVPAGSQLVAIYQNQSGQTVTEPVQMDVKTTNADGSAAMTVLTMQQPALAANSSTGVMLALAPAGTQPASPVDLASSLANYNLSVALSVQNASGGTTNYTISPVAALQAALASGSPSYILQGPDATEMQVSVPVTGSMQLVFNVTAYADGTFKTNVQFDNNLATLDNAATQISGGTLTYNATISQGGQVVVQQNNITQAQYQNWNQVVYSGSTPQVNIVHDINYLEQTGAIANYDLTTGTSTSLLNNEIGTMNTAGFGAPLAANGVTQFMPMTGGRGDIGPTTQANTTWLVTQNQDAAAYALGQAAAAGSVPWNIMNQATGQYLTPADPGASNVWDSPVGGPYSYTTGLSQPLQQPSDGWTPDPSHMPDLSYDAYLLTGSQYYLDELNAQAAYAVSSLWPATRSFDGSPNDIVINPGDQTRGSAWSIRAVDEAAYANPAGSAAKAYFTQVENDNYSWIVSQLPAWTKLEGQAYGYMPGAYGNAGSIGPWEQDYLASAVVQAAEMGNANAKTFLQWMSNFLVGRFTNAANGFDPNNGVAYNITVLPPADGGQQVTTNGNGGWMVQPSYQTWSAIQQATYASGWQDNGTGWVHSNGDFAELAAQSLAGIITVLQDPQAIKAYGWLMASGAPYVGASTYQQDPTYDIVPRLSDGQLLTGNNLIIRNDSSAVSIQGSNADQLIYEQGSGNVTITGGTGMNILFAGSGSDVLIGGANNDYLYAGSGNDTLYGGAGTNYMDASTGAPTVSVTNGTETVGVTTPGVTTFLLNTQDAATDTIADFKIGTDVLDVVNGSGQAIGSAQIASIIGSATQNAAGNAVLQLSANHSVTLLGISTSQLTAAMFSGGASSISSAPPPVVTVGGSSSGGSSGGSTGSTGSSGSAGTTSTGTVLTVGPNGQYATLAAAVAAAQNGDTIQVAAGTYTNDFVTINANITIEGVGGIANFVATVPPPNSKGIFDVTGNVTIDNLAFGGAAIPASLGNNAAGIRYESGNLVLNNDYFYNNQDGLLANADPSGSITINNSAFVHNGAGDGYSHNLYVGNVGTLSIDNSLFTGAVVGHEIKSRANTTIIQNSGIIDGATGTASYSVDLPNGGNATLQGNYIQKGPNAQNPAIISYGEEGNTLANSSLTVSGNTIVNQLSSSASTAVVNDTSASASLVNNTIYGLSASQLGSGSVGLAGNTLVGSLPAVNSAAPWASLLDNPPAFLATPQNLSFTTSGNDYTGTTGLLTIADSVGGNTIAGGSGGLVLTVASGNDAITTASGATDSITLNGGQSTLLAQGTDSVSVGSGAGAVITAAGPSTTVTESGGSVQLTETIGGIADTVSVSGGAATISATAQGITIDTASTGGVTIGLGDGPVQVNSAGADTISGGSGAATISASGAAQVTAGSGSLTFTGGAGTDSIQGGSGSYAINGGAGGVDFTGGTGSGSLQGSSGALNVTAGAGNVTLNGGTGNDVFNAGSGQAVFNQGTGRDSVTFGAGNTTVNASASGYSLFSYIGGHGGGTDVINGFDLTEDGITYSGFNTFIPVSNEYMQGNGVAFNLIDGTHVVMNNFTIDGHPINL